MTKLTEHFTLEELSKSDYAVRNSIDNTPDPLSIIHLTALCQNVLEPLRIRLNKPIIISSGYRCRLVNDAIGGAWTSQHVNGEAADLTALGLTVDELFSLVCRSGLPFDQAIQEFNEWVHVSYSSRNRRQKLIARKVDGKTQYTEV